MEHWYTALSVEKEIWLNGTRLKKNILIGSQCFLCDFALYGFMYHPSCCDCFCFCEVGIGVTCLLNAIIYKNEFEHIVLGAHGPLVQPSCSLRHWMLCCSSLAFVVWCYLLLQHVSLFLMIWLVNFWENFTLMAFATLLPNYQKLQCGCLMFQLFSISPTVRIFCFSIIANRYLFNDKYTTKKV